MSHPNYPKPPPNALQTLSKIVRVELHAHGDLTKTARHDPKCSPKRFEPFKTLQTNLHADGDLTKTIRHDPQCG